MRNAEHPYTITRLRNAAFPRGECILTFIHADKRRRLRLGTDNEAEARRRAPALYAEALRPAGTSIQELWDAYCRDKEGNPSVAIMQHQWKALRPWFGGMNAQDLKVADCRAYTAARRSAGIKDGTIITELGRIRTVLNWAVKHQHLDKAPHVERPSAVPSKTGHLTLAQVRALANACKTPHLKLFVWLAYATAGRAGAILDLTWDRCDFERNKINLENPEIKAAHKGRAVVPMNRSIKLRLLAAREGARSDYVIEWAGEKVGSVKKGLATASKAAGLPHVHAHMLRHSAAVRQAEEGVSMEEIASYLGHSDLKVTRRVYARFSPEALSKGAAALEFDDLEPVEVRRSA